MNNWRIIGFGSLIMLQALSGQSLAREPRLAPSAPAIAEPAAPEKPGPVFTDDERRRLQELRQWLMRRDLQRKQSAPDKSEVLREASVFDPPAWTRRPASGAQDGPHRGLSTPFSGRSPDGRIHHRYVFSDSGPDKLQPAAPYAARPPLESAEPRRRPSGGTGKTEARRRI